MILSFCLFMAMASGCSAEEEERSVSQTTGTVSDAEIVSEEGSGNTDLAGNSMSGKPTASDALAASDTEIAPEAENALGLPLMDGTVLLVTATRYRSSDDYQSFVAQYEYDNAGNQIRLLHTYYESDDAGNLTAHEPETVWTREYDHENRLVKYYDWRRPAEWYEYEYELFGVSEGDYPYDRIIIRKYLGSLFP